MVPPFVYHGLNCRLSPGCACGLWVLGWVGPSLVLFTDAGYMNGYPRVRKVINLNLDNEKRSGGQGDLRAVNKD